MTAQAGKKCDFYVTAGAPVGLTNEPMSDVSANYPGALARTVYAVTNGIKRYIAQTPAPVFQISLDTGGTWNTATPDFVDSGSIRFVAQQQSAPVAMLRVLSGNYLPYSHVAGGHEWEVKPTYVLKDSTEFPATSHTHTMIPLGEGEGKLKRFRMDDSMRSVLGNDLVAVFWLDATGQPAGPRYEAWVKLKTDHIKVPVADLEVEDLTFTLQSVLTFFGA